MAKALAAYRKARAVELALAGCDYDTIAKEVGYANRGTAWRTVQRALGERRDRAVDEYRLMELQRLDQIQQELWQDAVEGDVGAVQSSLKVIEQRIRLLGLAS